MDKLVFKEVYQLSERVRNANNLNLKFKGKYFVLIFKSCYPSVLK